jgi:hypothetical protein
MLAPAAGRRALELLAFCRGGGRTQKWMAYRDDPHPLVRGN